MTFSPKRNPGVLSAAGRTFAVAALAGAAMAFSVLGASAAGLFESLPESEAGAYAPQAKSPLVIRDRLVRLDYDYMEANMVPLNADRARDRLARAAKAPSIDIELFPDLTITLDREKVEKSTGDGGGYFWTGSVWDDRVGYSVFVISGGQMTGQILYKDRLFRIRPVEGDVHRITEIDESKFPPERFIRSPKSDNDAVSPHGLNAPAAASVITVILPYTRAAKKEAGNIVQTAKLAIKLANQGAKNGGAKVKYRYKGVVKTRYKEQSHSADLSNVQQGQGKLRVVHKQRKRKKADLVAMLRVSDNASGICGIGYLNENPSPSDRAYGFSVTSVGCVDYHSVAHEMGHNIGLEHDRYVVSPTPPKSEYNFGYSNVRKKIRSIMAYANECSTKGVTCTRVPMYSSSKKKYKGQKLGIRKGKKGAADASRALTENGKAIKKFY